MALNPTPTPNPNDPTAYDQNRSWSTGDLAQIDADLGEVEQQLDLLAGSVNDSVLAGRIRALSTRISQRRGFVRASNDARRSYIPTTPVQPSGTTPGQFTPGVTPMPGTPNPKTPGN